MVWHGYKHKVTVTLALGIVVLVLTFFGFPTSFFVYRHLRKKRIDRRRAYRVEKNKQKMDATYDNSAVTNEDCEQPVCST